jgi:hypothetical protein
MENTPDDFRPNALALIGLIDDHIPDSGAIGKIREYSAEPDEFIPIPGTKSEVRMAEHLHHVIERSVLGPGCLVEEPKELRCVRGVAM